MQLPLLTWGAVLLLLTILIIARAMRVVHDRRASRSHKMIEIGTEAEEIFVPGDRLTHGDYDYDEFDDI